MQGVVDRMAIASTRLAAFDRVQLTETRIEDYNHDALSIPLIRETETFNLVRILDSYTLPGHAAKDVTDLLQVLQVVLHNRPNSENSV